MNIPFKRVTRISVWGFFVSVFLINAGHVEGVLFPVSGKYVILSEKPEGTGLNIDMKFEKRRECQFDSVDWYVYFDENEKERFPINSRSPKFSRPLGTFRVNWIIEGAASYANHRMEIVTDHHCWGPLLWTTRTVNSIGRVEEVNNEQSK